MYLLCGSPGLLTSAASPGLDRYNGSSKVCPTDLKRFLTESLVGKESGGNPEPMSALLSHHRSSIVQFELLWMILLNQ